MSDLIYLERTEWIAERPFTDPENIAIHGNILRYMTAQLFLLLQHPRSADSDLRTVYLQRPDTQEWMHRLILAQPEKLIRQNELTIVGFFGQRRPEADVALAHEFDRILLAEIGEHPGLCSYSTMALSDGNYSNLVVFTDRAARNQWSTSEAHAQAVNTLTPCYYLTVTIYNGRLKNGIHDSDSLFLSRVKYYDYQCRPEWQAVREMVG